MREYEDVLTGNTVHDLLLLLGTVSNVIIQTYVKKNTVKNLLHHSFNLLYLTCEIEYEGSKCPA